jgi:hypothetical protein
MNKIFTMIAFCLLGLSTTYAQTFSDDFESYTVGSYLGPQSPDWTTWSAADGTTEDVKVVSTDNHTTAGSKSLYFSSTIATGGPTDCVLPFNTTPISTGHFTFTAWFKIPTGKDGYFNFQGSATIGDMYTLDCFLNSDGSVNIGNGSTLVLSATHPFDTWFELSIDVTLNSNSWNLLIDGVSAGTWQNANNQVYAIDIYPTDATASYWVDDVSYNVVPYTLPSINGATNLINITNGLVGQSRNLSVNVRNLGTTAITSFDLSVSQNAGTPVVQTISGANLASLAVSTVNITTPFTLVSGVNTFKAFISNVNGLGADGDATDDTTTTTRTPVTPAAGKMVVAEEGTGTWCQWCPRGAVYMDMMKTKYDGYFAGIAVHNDDPMTYAIYDAGIGALISGYPSALVDRTTAIDPSEIEPAFLNRITIAPKALIVNGATYNAANRELKVSLTSTIQQNITGNYKIACVIIEDSITGTTTDYRQSNAYAGGANGVMGGFELLANPVPAAQMNYNHVARTISPSFAGASNAFGASATAAQEFTHTFTFTLPAEWDSSQIHIIGLFIAPTGLVDNASSTTIAQAITNGYITGTEIGASIADLSNIGDLVSLYPNPTANNADIMLNLEKESNVSVAIYSANGALVAKKEYGNLSGGMVLPIQMTDLGSGLYFINVTIDGKTSIKKLVKE